EGQPSPRRRRKPTSNGSAAVMTLKRSVSPDGRIDSLSVELSCPIDQVASADIKARANSMLTLQREIASGFLKPNGKPNSNGRAKSNGHNEQDTAVTAKMLSINATRNGNFS